MVRKTVCLTPVKNEEWIIGKFLQAASLWADHIVLADQNSTDNTIRIARKFHKVKIINNPFPGLDEYKRQDLLINEARLYPGEKIFVALDADEFLTPNFSSPEWSSIDKSCRGTSFSLSMANIKPNFKQMWYFNKKFPLIFIDDGTTHQSGSIHQNRLPQARYHVELSDVQVMHLQYLNPQRNQAKLRWYQAWEAVHRPDRHPVDVYRQYNHHLCLTNQLSNIPKWWLTEYQKYGNDLTTISRSESCWWDKEIQSWIKSYGKNKFRYYDARDSNKIEHFDPPAKLLLGYLRFTQPYYPKFLIPRIDNLIKRFVCLS